MDTALKASWVNAKMNFPPQVRFGRSVYRETQGRLSNHWR
ncbi:hypothetical protein SCOR_01800 [Sulfidibacter corallicola]